MAKYTAESHHSPSYPRDSLRSKLPSSSRCYAVAGLEGTAGESTPPLRSSSVMLTIIIADIRLRELFHYRRWSFLSSVASMMVQFAGKHIHLQGRWTWSQRNKGGTTTLGMLVFGNSDKIPAADRAKVRGSCSSTYTTTCRTGLGEILFPVAISSLFENSETSTNVLIRLALALVDSTSYLSTGYADPFIYKFLPEAPTSMSVAMWSHSRTVSSMAFYTPSALRRIPGWCCNFGCSRKVFRLRPFTRSVSTRGPTWLAASEDMPARTQFFRLPPGLISVEASPGVHVWFCVF